LGKNLNDIASPNTTSPTHAFNSGGPSRADSEETIIIIETPAVEQPEAGTESSIRKCLKSDGHRS
jgi:hypothetical protein